MKALLVAPAVLAIVLGLAIQLEEVARSSSEKALDFADDMNSAMDCARLGRPIRECSPGLYEMDFDDEIEQTMDILQEFEDLNLTDSELVDVIILVNDTEINDSILL